MITNEKPKRNLILEDSIEFENMVETEGIENLIEKAVIFPKV